MLAYGPFSDCPGLGDDEYPGFPADVCPEEMPDFTKHHSLLADVFKKDPGLYHKYRRERTRLGVGLAKCIKTGADNRGHPMIKTVGLVAGDEYCYDTFAPIFDRVIRQRHGDERLSLQHITDMDRKRLTLVRADPSGRFVLSTQIRAARSLAGVRFPPALAMNDRREVERVIVRALMEMDGALKGDYFPLPASQSYAPKPGGMSVQDEEELRNANLVFDQPDSTTTLCSGVGRHWPDARGVFVNTSRSFSVWVNEEEHLRAIAVRKLDAIQEAFLEMAEALDNIAVSLRRHGDCSDGFAHSSRLGFLTSCPSNLGTAMRVSVILRLPLLTQQDGLAAWCARRRLTLRSAIDESGAQLAGVVEVSNCDRLGVSEVDAVNLVIEAVSQLVLAEQRLEKNGPGLEASPPPGATVSAAPAQNEAPSAPSPTPSDLDNTNLDVAFNALGLLFSCAVEDRPCKLDKPEDLISPRQTKDSAQADKDAAAAKIQAIQRGRAERQEVQKKKEEEHKSAAKIQAIQRGKTERKEVERHKQEVNAAATKIQAIHRGKTARTKTVPDIGAGAAENVDDVRQRMRVMLESAESDGSLQKIIKSIRDSPDGARSGLAALEHVRERMKATLEAAVDDGSLAATLNQWNSKARIPPEKMEEVRREMQQMLEEANENGMLVKALAEVKQENGAADRKRQEIDSARLKMKDLLTKSADSGDLEAALKSTFEVGRNQAANGMNLENIRLQVKQVLESAASTGALTEALLDVKGQNSEEPDIHDIRAKMKDMLQEACDSGALADALAYVKDGIGEAEDLEDIRVRMKDMLESACDSGALADALSTSWNGGAANSLDDIRLQMKDILEAACDSGDLAAALAAGRNQGGDLEDIRLQMKDMLEAACDSGDLAAALADSQRGGAESLDDIRLQMKELLEEACDNGQLHEALSAGRGGGLEDIRSQMKNMLEAACDNGDLATALAAEKGLAAAPPSDLICRDLLADFTHADEATFGTAGSMPLLLAVSNCDRRIGALNAMILEAQRRIQDQEACALKLEAEIASARQESQQLGEEYDRQQRVLGEADETYRKLQEQQKKLFDDLDDESLKHRHCILDLDPNTYSARSELSTVCTVRDLQNTDLHSPFSQMTSLAATATPVYNLT